MKPIRNSAKAVILDKTGQHILLTKNRDRDGFFYLFPGGGQEKGEELKDAVARECMEEIGCEVQVNDILYIREYIGSNHEFAEWDHDIHQVEFYFRCTIENERQLFNGTNPDEDQVGVEWIELKRLDEIRIYPRGLVEPIRKGLTEICYIGDSN